MLVAPPIHRRHAHAPAQMGIVDACEESCIIDGEDIHLPGPRDRSETAIHRGAKVEFDMHVKVAAVSGVRAVRL